MILIVFTEPHTHAPKCNDSLTMLCNLPIDYALPFYVSHKVLHYTLDYMTYFAIVQENIKPKSLIKRGQYLCLSFRPNTKLQQFPVEMRFLEIKGEKALNNLRISQCPK